MFHVNQDQSDHRNSLFNNSGLTGGIQPLTFVATEIGGKYPNYAIFTHKLVDFKL